MQCEGDWEHSAFCDAEVDAGPSAISPAKQRKRKETCRVTKRYSLHLAD